MSSTNSLTAAAPRRASPSTSACAMSALPPRPYRHRRRLRGADAELPDRAQPGQHPAAIVDQRLRGARHDARHHRRRHRPVGGPTAAMSAVVAAALMAAGVPIALAIPRRSCSGPRLGHERHARAFGGLQPFIVTLGTLSLYRACALIYTGGNPIFGIPPAFRSLFNSSVFGIPNPVVIVAVLALVVWIVLNKTPLGEYFLAVGGNERPRTSPASRRRDQDRDLHDLRRACRRCFPDPRRAPWCGRSDDGQPVGTRRHRRGCHRRRLADGRQGLDRRHAARRHHPR